MTTTPEFPETAVDAGREAAAEALGDTYACTRVWEAWSYGTMTEEDFVPASEDESIPGDVTRAVLTAAWPHLHPAPASGDVHAERLRQDEKWGQQNHPDGTGSSSKPLAAMAASGVTADWLANSATTATDTAAERGVVTWRHILLEEVFEALAESDPADLRTELIQVAAVATQWAEAIDRRGDAQ